MENFQLMQHSKARLYLIFCAPLVTFRILLQYLKLSNKTFCQIRIFVIKNNDFFVNSAIMFWKNINFVSYHIFFLIFSYKIHEPIIMHNKLKKSIMWEKANERQSERTCWHGFFDDEPAAVLDTGKWKMRDGKLILFSEVCWSFFRSKKFKNF